LEHDAAAGVPLVSIIIPVWNRAGLIFDALASIKGPDTPDWEIVVVDDGSTDDSVEKTRAAFVSLGLENRARLIEQDNAGPGPARNTAAAHARGTYLACLDSDDMWFEWTLPTLMGILRDTPKTDVFFMRSAPMADRRGVENVIQTKTLLHHHTGFLDAFLADSTTIFFGTDIFVCKRRVFDAAGGFSDNLRVAEDLDMFLRLPLEAPLIDIIEPPMIAHITSTAGSLTTSYDDAFSGLKVLQANERSGQYPGGAGQVRNRNIFLARVTTFTIQNGWANGRYLQSYGLFLRNAWSLANNRCRLFIFRYHKMIARSFWRAAKGLLGQ
jgi:glycosyltransferase involved in cell wall biosynthesis